MTSKRTIATVACVAFAAGTFGGIVTSAVAQGGGKHFPEMEKALRQLNNAKLTLNSAKHDFKGHRSKAAEFVDKAIDEVNKGIAEGP